MKLLWQAILRFGLDMDDYQLFKKGILWILKELLADKAGMDPQFFHTVMKVATAKLKCTEAELLQEIRDAAL